MSELNRMIEFRCNRCNHRLFDCEVAGDFRLEMKCVKCRQILSIRGRTYIDYMNRMQDNTSATVRV